MMDPQLAPPAEPSKPKRVQKWVSKQAKQWLRFYFNEAQGDARRAAELAGYKSAAIWGKKLKAKFKKEIAERELELAESRQMKAQEVVEELTIISRDRDHPQQVRALEILTKIHGLQSDKVSISVDRGKLMKDLDQQMILVHEALKAAKPKERRAALTN